MYLPLKQKHSLITGLLQAGTGKPLNQEMIWANLSSHSAICLDRAFKKDSAQAAYWLRKAAEQRQPCAEALLASL